MSETIRGRILVLKLSDHKGLPATEAGFSESFYYDTGIRLPLQEFGTMEEIVGHLVDKSNRIGWGVGDAFIMHTSATDRVTTLVAVLAESPVLHDGKPHAIYRLPVWKLNLLQLSRSFQEVRLTKKA